MVRHYGREPAVRQIEVTLVKQRLWSRAVPKLVTIGYEGASLGALLRTLKAARVRQLIDVRELPLSRKKGFSKSALGARLMREGIGYLHLRDLGDPKPGRMAARGGDYFLFKQIFRRHLKTARAQRALAELGAAAARSKVCLLCYEANPAHCHRAIVASRLAGTLGIEVEHLFVEPPP